MATFFSLFLSFSELVGAGRLLDADLDLGLLELLAVDLDAGAHDVTGDDGTDALRRARQDDVALLQRHDLGDVAQEPRELEQHEVRRVLLLHLAVDAEVQLYGVRVRDRRLRDDVADRQEGVEPLGDVPGETLLLGLVLDVPRRHVDAEGVAFLFVVSWLVFLLQLLKPME